MDYVGIILSVLLVIVIAILSWWAVPTSTPKGITRLQLLSARQRTQKTLIEWTRNDALDLAFIDAGLPWLNASRWFIIRTSLITVSVLIAISGYAYIGKFSAYTAVFISWWFTRTKKPSFLYNILNYLKRHRLYEMNRDLHILYDLLIQDVEITNQSQATNLYQTLKRLHYFLYSIRAPVQQMLLRWADNPEAAIKRFGEAVSTEEGVYLAQVLLDVQKSTPGTALDLLKNQFIAFDQKRISERQSLRKVKHTIDFTIQTIGVYVMGFNAMMVITQFTNLLMTSKINL